MFIKMVLLDIKETIEIPEGVEVMLEKSLFKCKGPKGENQRKLVYKGVEISQKDKAITLEAIKPSKREKKMLNTFKAHINNMIEGVLNGFTYKVKVCHSHFPMNVSIDNNKVVIKNFLGEKIPRKAKIVEGVDVKLDNDIIVIESYDKEKAGQMASRIEQSTRITNRDRRVFQDGCFIIEKAGAPIK